MVREECYQPNHYVSNKTLHEYLAESGIPGISGVDTRAITRKLRSSGVMMGIITSDKTPQQALEELQKLLAVVSQRSFIFNDTIRANILMGKHDASEAEVMAAAREAGLEAFLAASPYGLDRPR